MVGSMFMMFKGGLGTTQLRFRFFLSELFVFYFCCIKIDVMDLMPVI